MVGLVKLSTVAIAVAIVAVVLWTTSPIVATLVVVAYVLWLAFESFTAKSMPVSDYDRNND